MFLQTCFVAIFLLMCRVTLLHAAESENVMEINCLDSSEHVHTKIANIKLAEDINAQCCNLVVGFGNACVVDELTYGSYEEPAQEHFHQLDNEKEIYIHGSETGCVFLSRSSVALDGSLDQFKRLLSKCDEFIKIGSQCQNDVLIDAENKYFASGKELGANEVQGVIGPYTTTTAATTTTRATTVKVLSPTSTRAVPRATLQPNEVASPEKGKVPETPVTSSITASTKSPSNQEDVETTTAEPSGARPLAFGFLMSLTLLLIQ